MEKWPKHTISKPFVVLIVFGGFETDRGVLDHARFFHLGNLFILAFHFAVPTEPQTALATHGSGHAHCQPTFGSTTGGIGFSYTIGNDNQSTHNEDSQDLLSIR